MTPIGTPELVLLLVALGGMTAAATWGVIELKKPRRWMWNEASICLMFFREQALPRLERLLHGARVDVIEDDSRDPVRGKPNY